MSAATFCENYFRALFLVGLAIMCLGSPAVALGSQSTSGQKLIQRDQSSIDHLASIDSKRGFLAPLKGKAVALVAPAAAPQELVKSGVTFVLTTWSGDKGGFPRVNMLVKSLNHFAEPGSIYELLIVTPPQDQADVQRRAANGFDSKTPLSFPVRVITDYDALGSSDNEKEYKLLTPLGELSEHGGRGTNYRKSMLLKLGVATEVRTKFYLLLDSDVFLKRHMSLEDLLPEGKALLQGSGGQPGQPGQHRSSWWKSSTSLLEAGEECSADKISKDFSIGVTPSILSTEVSTGLLEHLGGKGKWDLELFKQLRGKHIGLVNTGHHDWTEYTLYWTWACMAGRMKSDHTLVNGRHLYDETGFATSLSSISEYPVKKIFEDQSSLFGNVQTVGGITTADVISHIGPYFEPGDI